MTFHRFTQDICPGQELPSGRRIQLARKIGGGGVNIGGLDCKLDQAHREIFRGLARLDDGPPECRHLRFKMLADRLQELAVIGNCQEVLQENIEDVFDPIQIRCNIGRPDDPG